MCRALSYLGPPIVVDDVLYKPDSSLVRQSYEPQLLEMLNLGGFGMVAWDDTSHVPEKPWKYRSIDLPIFDTNLKSLSEKIRATCLLAHVRGIAYRADAGFGPHNLHPFFYEGQRWAMAHNGDLHSHKEMKHDLLAHMTPEIRQKIRGTTDSETVYALVLSALARADRDEPSDMVDAICSTLRVLRDVRAQHGVDINSALNLFFSDGRSVAALRYTLDYGCYPVGDPEPVRQRGSAYLSLWYTMGEAYRCIDGAWQMTGDPGSTNAVMIASEPLSRDVTGWFEVPEYTILVVDRAARRVRTVEVEW